MKMFIFTVAENQWYDDTGHAAIQLCFSCIDLLLS